MEKRYGMIEDKITPAKEVVEKKLAEVARRIQMGRRLPVRPGALSCRMRRLSGRKW